MHVDSRLDSYENINRKQWRKGLTALNGLIFSFPDWNTTVVLLPEFPGSRMMLVSVSMAEPRETKFKRKVGEFHALRRVFSANEYIKVPSVFAEYDYLNPDMARDWAENFARSIAN